MGVGKVFQLPQHLTNTLASFPSIMHMLLYLCPSCKKFLNLAVDTEFFRKDTWSSAQLHSVRVCVRLSTVEFPLDRPGLAWEGKISQGHTNLYVPIGDIRFGHCYLSEPTIITHPAIPSILHVGFS